MFARVPEGSDGVYLQRACLIIAGILVRPRIGRLKFVERGLTRYVWYVAELYVREAL